MTRVKPPTPRPCESCPFRRDVPSGIWSAGEYEKLPDYDGPTGSQPPSLFLCHQTDKDSPVVRVCAGWAGTYDGHELLALRLAVPYGVMTVEDVLATYDYSTDVPLWSSGQEAADHGLAEIEWPGETAAALIDKIVRVRKDLTES